MKTWKYQSARNASVVDSQPESPDAPAARPLSRLRTRLLNFAKDPSVLGALPRPDGYRTFKTGAPIWSDKNADDSIFVLERGDAFAFSILPDGRRHISDFFGPGAICNWTRLRAPTVRMDIYFRRGAEVSVFSRPQLLEAIEDAPRLENLIARHELARALRLSQRSRTLITSSAADRVIIMLLDLQSEARVAGQEHDPIALPFNQTEIADLIGQTNVHVNRVLKTLTTEGRIERTLHAVRLLHPEEEASRLDYRDYFEAPRSAS